MSAAAPRLLFQAHSRRGLGHLSRGLNLAGAIRALAPGAEIAFHVSNPGAASCCPSSFRCLVDDGAAGATTWAEAVRAVDPHIAVFDTVLKREDVAATTSRRVFVLRKQHEATHADLLAGGALAAMDLIVVPHVEAEFEGPLPSPLRERTAFVGPIVRLPDAEVMHALRRKYAIADGDFVLTSTAGGGGFAETATRLFDTVWQAHARLSPLIARLRHIVVLGPQNSMSVTGLPGMTVVQCEPEMVSLLALSSLVVAEGGYNTVNEIRAVKTPAIFIPGARTYDDQEERVRPLERLGFARVLTGLPRSMAKDIVAIATSPYILDSMRRCYGADRLEAGNRAAAERILELAR